MSFYRGVGGSGDANDDASISQVTTAQVAAAASQAAAATSASNAATSASNAATSASNAATSASNAATSATAADLSKDDAAASALAASTSETNASASETAAAASEAAALASETAALASETAAGASETAAAASEATATAAASSASTSATSATASAASASTSASAASGSAAAALASQVAAAASETAAAASETAAAASEATATTAATTATTAATNASTSASAASSSQTAAAASEAAAATSSSNAATSASNAATSASNAATSASNASSSATSAAVSASSASSAADAALAALDNFDDRYLGQKASDPTLDNDGNALLTGALYFNTVDGIMKVYDGSAWLAAYASLSGALLTTNNLSDVADAPTARTNLGLGTAATTASTDYATAAQGALADTAVQPAAIANMLESTDIGVTVQGYNANTVVDASYVHTDNNYTTTEKNKLAGIADGAEVNVNADWNAVSGDAQILNKPTAVSSFTNDSGYITSSDSITGNAATATTWQTPRTLTIGATGKSVNGGSNVNWTVSEVVGFTPVQQGGGTGQGTNKLYMGWTGSALGLQIDSTNFAATWPISVTGGASTATTATNLSGGTVAATTGSFSNTLSVTGATTVANYINRTTASGNSAWLQQDGTGRVHWYWNTFGGTSPTFTNANEDASAISLSVTNNGAGGQFFARSASGVGKAAGAAISWTTTLYADLNVLTYKGNTVLRSDNYNSYAPTLTGTGASGTWGISITGNAGTLDGLDSTAFARFSSGGTLSDSLATAAWVANYGGSSNIDHIWHDDGGNIWNFCSDTTFKNTGNSGIRAGIGTFTKVTETRVALGSNAINLSSGSYFTRTISAAATFTVSNVPASGLVGAFVLELTNGGSAAVTWFSGVTWAAGTPPTLTAAGVDTLAFFTHNGGTTWRGFVLGQGMA